MKLEMTGRAWVFRSKITTDDILPGAYLDRSNDEVGRYAMAGSDPDFATAVQPGDFVVGTANFGSGSGRESAPYALKNAGVAAVIAPSFGRLFFRNAINIGLVPVVCPTLHVETGDSLTVDLERRCVVDHRRGTTTHPIENLTGISREILAAGGLIPYTKQRLAQGRPPRPGS